MQGHVGEKNHAGTTRPATRRIVGIGVATLLALGTAGVGIAQSAAAASGPAAATATGKAPPPSSAGSVVTTVTSPTTSTTTTTSPRTTTTSTTAVHSTPTTVTSTTVTVVTPTTTGPPTTGTTVATPAVPVAKSTTTTTSVPRTTTTTTTAPVATTTTTTTTGVPPTTVPVAPTFDTTCTTPATPALQTYLDSLPSGSVFHSSTTACYLVPNGIELSHPITIVGGTFYDPSTARSTVVVPARALRPIILIRDTTQVTLSGVSVLGANAAGAYHASLVGEAGVKVVSSSDVTLDRVSATDTFGDGLELVADLSHRITTPDTGLSVEGYTTTNAGRQGVTVAEVSGATLDHVTIVNPADDGFDFESDLANAGSGNISITNCSDDHGFNMIETLTGPVTVTGCTGFHHITASNIRAAYPVNFVGGTLTCRRGDPVPCINQIGGSLTFTGTTVARMVGTGKVTESVWSVQSGGALRFVRSPIADPMGTVGPTSTVQFK